MAIELHDANLQKAKGELTQLIQALAALQITQVGGDAVGLDPVTATLAWIDWDEARLRPSVEALGAAQRSGTAIGEFTTGIEVVESARDSAMDMWKGDAANVFLAYSNVVLDNCRKIVPELDAMRRTISEADGGEDSVPGGMKERTKAAWKAAAAIADDPQTRRGIDAVLHRGENGTSLADGRLLLLDAITQLKDRVTAQIERIDDEVTPLVSRHIRVIEQRDPEQTPTQPKTGFEIRLPEARKVATAMRMGIADMVRAKKLLDQVWAVPNWTFGTSNNATALLKAWQKAVTYRANELHRCIKKVEGMYGGMSATFHLYSIIEFQTNEAVGRILNGDLERQKLHDYSQERIPTTSDGGLVLPPLLNSYLKEEIAALHSGKWDGVGNPPRLPPNLPEDLPMGPPAANKGGPPKPGG
jgi:hypothetical protein